MTSDPHAPLRDDIHLLGDLLGERLRISEGVELFDTVERVRALSKSAHLPNGEAAFGELAALLSEMPLPRALTVARAFSQFLTLANVAEQYHRIRRRRDYQRNPGSRPQRGSFDESFARLIAAGVAPEALHEAVNAMHVELVFTAHPTEIVRRTLAHAYARIADLLATLDRPDLTSHDRESTLGELRAEVAIVWGTDEVRDVRPTPLDEVRAGLAVFEQTLWDAVPDACRALDSALRAHTGRPLPLTARPLTFGSWIGGDRDGNPNVTADVTRRATLMARWVAVDLFIADLQALASELSLERGSVRLHERAGTDREPYRALLRDARKRLRAARRRVEEALVSGAPRIEEPITIDELREVLALCHQSLIDTHNDAIAGGRLSDAIRRAHVFGLALVPLDIRQEADKHTEALDAISGGEFSRLDERARQQWLLERMKTSHDPVSRQREIVKERSEGVFEALRMAAGLHRDSLGAYVITMASTPSDVLAVEYLQRLAGVIPRMRVVPLFETAADLHHAAQTLTELLAIPEYRARVEENGGRQEVMVGYSDSAKDAGRFAAAWDLYRAQEEIVGACRDSGVRLTLFHGRGGSVGRGGGPTYLAIQSQPPGSIDGTLRVTEQGEMLQAKFGLRGIAERTLEVYATATLEATLAPQPPASSEARATANRLADLARLAFHTTIDTPDFIEYFRQATPEHELELTNIGSRPGRRPRGSQAGDRPAGLESLRAIPWQFAWTQTRLLLASWLGVEAALADERSREVAGRLYREWPFFRSAIDLIEMVLAKADARIAAEYDRRLVEERLRPLGAHLRQQLDLAIHGVLAVTGHRTLLEENRVLRRSIDVRNPYVDPINLVQIELLRRLRSGEARRPDADLAAAFVVTVNGIAAGMRNTG